MAGPPAAEGASTALGGLPPDMASVLAGSLPAFDRKELLAPAMLTPIFAAADARGAAAKAALQEARAGQLGAAAMTALGDGDQALATFLKGLDLLSQSQVDRAVVQLQTAMQMAPAFVPARLYLGAALAETNRHKEAAGLLQSGVGAAPTLSAPARVAAEEWIKAGQASLAIAPLEQALSLADTDTRARKLLGVAYALSGRAGDAVPVLAPYLDGHPTDQAALLAALYGTYMRHQAAPQPETIAADRDRAVKWAKAYSASGGPLQPLVAAWMKHLEGVKP